MDAFCVDSWRFLLKLIILVCFMCLPRQHLPARPTRHLHLEQGDQMRKDTNDYHSQW